MDQVFPLGFAFATGFYLVLYLLTFMLHQAFMHYVLAGSLYLVWCKGWCDSQERPFASQRLADLVRDWLPFLLSAAITAGVAPLLFVQIVYQHEFYTANLLLWWRWMVVVPVLIVAFYLLYLLKSRVLWTWPSAIRIPVLVTTAACFIFVGFCWTANHLIANRPATWPETYTSGVLPFSVAEVVLRMLIWIGGSFGSFAAIVGWQRLYQQHAEDEPSVQNGTRTLSLMALAGNTLALAAGLAYTLPDSSTRRLVWSVMVAPYTLTAILGLAVQYAGWIRQRRFGKLQSPQLVMCSVGAFFSLLGVSVIREGMRLQSVDVAQSALRHQEAASMGGFAVFLVAAVAVSAVIAWCFWLVRTGFVATTQ